ncbi:MAG: nucleotide sugar dehydrogenase [Planctomycetes bacterium]|nr:nucleotide sugar dehydrogenase [Planctomycetota bacterium]
MNLLEKIEKKTARVGIIGLGYVGLPLARVFCEGGFQVEGFDIDPAKVEALRAGRSYIKHIASEKVAELVLTRRVFTATTDFARLRGVDAIIICVPTPLNRWREPDLSYIEKTAESITPHLATGQLVILESTTYPGTTDEVVKPILEKGGKRAGIDFLLAFSPEREDPGNPNFSTDRIPKVVGGYDAASAAAAEKLYGSVVVRVVPVSSTRAAEAVKLLENIYRCINIAMVNELKMLFTRMGLDVWEIIAAASTKPFGFSPFYPGPGLGGHCIPIDPFYLTWKAREFEFPTRFIELAGEINAGMPLWVVGRVMDALNERRQTLNGARILLLGAAYKRDVDDARESPALKIIELLEARGAQVAYNDPHIPRLPSFREYPHLKRMESQALTPDLLGATDCVVIATDHAAYDYQWIVDHSRLVVDSRNATAKVTRNRDRIVKA